MSEFNDALDFDPFDSSSTTLLEKKEETKDASSNPSSAVSEEEGEVGMDDEYAIFLLAICVFCTVSS